MQIVWLVIKGMFSLALVVLLAACVQHYRNSGKSNVAMPVADTLRFATYNVHYIILQRASGAWSVEDWERRKGPLDAAFKAIGADVIAFQEMESFARGGDKNINLARDWLLEQNPEYAAGANGDAEIFPSTQPIFYRKDKLTLLEQGWFFFSATPDVIYSRTFNGSFPAFASWVHLQDQAGRKLRVVNVHFEFKSISNRRQSAELIVERTKEWIANGETIVLLGDLNARLGAETVQILERGGFTFSDARGATYHLNRGLNLFGAIDHIARSGDIAPENTPVVLREKFRGEWPTDHYPVFQDFKLLP